MMIIPRYYHHLIVHIPLYIPLYIPHYINILSIYYQYSEYIIIISILTILISYCINILSISPLFQFYIPINITSLSGVWGWPLCWRTAWSARPGTIVGLRLENFWKFPRNSEKIFWKICFFLEILDFFLENWKAIGTFWRTWILLQRILGSFWKTILGSKTFQALESHVGVIFKKWNQHLEHGQLLIFLVWWAISTSGCVRRFQHGGASLSPRQRLWPLGRHLWSLAERHEMGPWFHGVPWENRRKTMENHRNTMGKWGFV